MKPTRMIALTLAAMLAAPALSLAWGTHGHHIINRAAAEALPASLPSFLRTKQAINEIAMLGSNQDDLKGAGESWNEDHNPGHYLDLQDNGSIGGVIKINALPDSRAAFNKALEAGKTSAARTGYLPYSILDGWEQLRKDFAYWRVASYQATHAASASARSRAANQREVWQALVLRDIGVWGHFVGDGSQPLHVTDHYNGWGRAPNPHGFTTKPGIHSMFESAFVNRYAKLAAVQALMKPTQLSVGTKPIAQDAMLANIVAYLKTTNAQVPAVYRFEKAAAFAHGAPQAIAFTDGRLAAAASELRDLVVLAYMDSLNIGVGYPEYTVRSILSGHPQRAPRGGGD